ncbi:M28 family peptidase [Robertkochia aurantiaca]|uniref:M28 family peptidase n=1 Tax=Robertkochia aurantiaca TaxID=2873700 RepID=UPI001CCA50E5|nr:M28 family peptidase [Robertkochia sp. 3YJGBD-33]
MKIVIYAAALLTIGCNSAQQSSSKSTAGTEGKEAYRVSYANSITEEELKEHLFTYASDEFRGRETATEGERIATDYLRDFYKDQSINPGAGENAYFQKVPLVMNSVPEGTLTIEGETLEQGEDFIMFSAVPKSEYELVHAGYGIESSEYSDYADMDVSGKVVIVYGGEPRKEDGTYLLTGNNTPSDWSNWRETLSDRIEIASEKGAAGMIYVDDAYFNRASGRYKYYQQADHGGSMQLKKDTDKVALVFMSTEKATEKLAVEAEKPKGDTGKTLSFDLKNTNQELFGNNVVAVIEGSSKPEEYVILSAHLDHVGINSEGEIHNGADDDGSGTVALLEIAEAFKEAKDAGHGPERTVVFLHVTGEEKGLFGSEYYTDNPVYPLEQTVANLNVDMIGRIDPKRDGDRNYVYLIGSDKLSSDLHELSEEVNERFANITLDYKYNAEDDPNRFYYRSDHYNFAKHNIPIIFYFNGTHDDYHRPSDTPDKINYDLLTNRARLIFHTAWEVANRPERPVVDKAVSK